MFFLLLSCAPKKIEVREKGEGRISDVQETKITPGPEEILEKAKEEMEKFASPNYKRAIKLLQELLNIYPHFREAYPLLSKCYALMALEKKELEMENLELWAKAYFYLEESKDVLNNDYFKAKALLLMSKNVLSEQEYGRIFSLTQPFLRRWGQDMYISLLKDIYRSSYTKSEDEIIESLNKALSNNPEDWEALLFKWLIESPGYEESKEIKKVFSLRPEIPLPYYEIGKAKFRVGKIEEAEKWLKDAIERNSEHPLALHLLGEISISKGNGEEGISLIEKAISLEPELPNSHFVLGTLYYDFGEDQRALEEFKKALDLRPLWEDPYFQSSLILMEDSRWDEAISYLSEVIKLHGRLEIFGLTFRATCNLMLGIFEKAESDCKQAIEINSDFVIPYFVLGLISFKKGNFLNAKGNFLKSIKIDPYYSDAHFYLGQTYLHLKNKSLAKKELRKAKELFEREIIEIERKIKEAKEKKREKKVLKLLKKKEEIKEKIEECISLSLTIK